MQQPLRVLEFFSGIGGLHYGLERAESTATVLASFDVNEHANSCYQHNFGIKPSNKSIDTLTAKDIEKYDSNCWLLSPPCQPFTQGGKSLDHQDNRSLALLRIIEILQHIAIPPRFVFVENVPNFETSECRSRLVQALDQCNYDVKEYLISPIQIGISNDRRRYYLAAKLRSSISTGKSNLSCLQTSHMITRLDSESSGIALPIPPAISTYLEQHCDISEFLVPEQYILKRKTFRFDLVKPTDTRCSCFTKAYGSHHIIGSGSFLQTANLDATFASDDGKAIVASRPRFFTPREIARLHGFPIDGVLNGSIGMLHTFEFPDSVPRSQQYKLLGNSLSVDVVAYLLKLLFLDSDV
ncbi:hypothetical protein BDEG_23423 [Batrachochytrium dendrobatidis JEL423]|uniref:tRNA (cytosine(38)-C(5))-methyltransferase n=1 Tax=Batrachochytrium dendrobatidis (strain JEL423) TaxID=403673 RepID=A0A177WJC9_BATDL|nr:hypothetical protein BDEG_23423 [Batrachochytrium dendrobatidis JEL423]